MTRESCKTVIRKSCAGQDEAKVRREPGWWTKLWWTSRHSSLYRNLTFPLKWAEPHHPPNAILLSSSQYQAISELVFCSRSQFSTQKYQTLNLFLHWLISHYSSSNHVLRLTVSNTQIIDTYISIAACWHDPMAVCIHNSQSLLSSSISAIQS